MKFKDFFKETIIKEVEFTFGDQSDAEKEAELNAKYDTPIANMDATKSKSIPNLKIKTKFKEARGFIKPNGIIERIGDMPHETFAMDIGYPIVVDGKTVNKKFSNSKFLCIATKLIRWSPETSSLSVYRQMTDEQINTIRAIIKSYGFKGIWVEYMNKAGQLDMIEFGEGDPSLFNAKIAGVQHRVNDKALGQK